MTNRPAVVIKSKFIAGSDGGTSFNEYLNYMDRAETHDKVNEFEKYQDYMSNEEKSTGLFTFSKDSLNDSDKVYFKEEFKKAQESGSLLWQDVISFDNDWLKESGVLEHKNVDNKQIQDATRSAVQDMLKKEGMIDSAIWTGAIHYNTDNIHVHVAIVQTKDFKERGKRKQASIDSMKSKVANKITDRSKHNEKLNLFIRERVIASKRDDPLNSLKNQVMNRDLVRQFKKIHKQLPEDKRLWRYNMNAIQTVRPEIDKLTTLYIEKNFKEEFKDFHKQLEKEVEIHKRMYGNSAHSERYREMKMTDLYTRMGNTILKEVSEYDRKQKEFSRKNGKKPSKFIVQRDLNKAVYLVNRYAKDELETSKNQKAYEELQKEQEYER
ncbi:MobP2 family relaxase [Planococcus beijingensis]|uniref:MobP2 family relaxase n=1 Tax=Planococcus beijingensis TaxID=2782551 RepID=UPI00193B5F6A|nr:MobP2 family relaxase [Planococcus beijingensis]